MSTVKKELNCKLGYYHKSCILKNHMIYSIINSTRIPQLGVLPAQVTKKGSKSENWTKLYANEANHKTPGKVAQAKQKLQEHILSLYIVNKSLHKNSLVYQKKNIEESSDPLFQTINCSVAYFMRFYNQTIVRNFHTVSY